MSVITEPGENGTNGCGYFVEVTKVMPSKGEGSSSIQIRGDVQDLLLENGYSNEELSYAFWTNGPEKNDFLTGYEFPNQGVVSNFDGLDGYAAEIKKLHSQTVLDPALFVGEMEKRISKYSVLPSDLRDALTLIYKDILDIEFIRMMNNPRKVVSSLLKKGLLTDDMIRVLNNDSRFGKSNENFKKSNYLRTKDNF